ncbi:thermonuclease family protein [Devosia sp. SD17-2]|uniref:thermonuclease family protein n=1 Tax=Devosia sp. SD17-2 TaxID=2976459 RepID=UPI0023D8610E|nr:thermonuclease family protein [Devosia sp. SD17-2]WEJ34728.1 thermonuclease family protein [Devosia sp. SD17-2]
MASLSDILELSRSRRQRRRLPFLVLALIAFGVGGAATTALNTALNKTGIADWMLSRASASSLVAQRSFPVCAGTVRITCVVDGDTFWLDEVKYRVADINTPEIGQPQCTREATLGREATSRFAQLLSAGPFELHRIDRDQDQYGRKLRIVERDGKSLGDILVDEGLAHTWRGQREGWC